MFAMNLLDVTDHDTEYGMLICCNNDIDENIIQNKVMEIKNIFEANKEDWNIRDIISKMPKNWQIILQPISKNIMI
jgi:hypothetical protein